MKWIKGNIRPPSRESLIRVIRTKEVVELDEPAGFQTVTVWDKTGKTTLQLSDIEWLDESTKEIDLLKEFVSMCELNDRFPDLIKKG